MSDQLAVPGIYQNIPFADYNAMPYVRNSYLKKLTKGCPAAVKVEDEEKDHLTLGRAIHALVLEGQQAFQKDFIVSPQDAPGKPTAAMLNAKKPSAESIYKIEWWSQFERMSAGKSIITYDDFVSIQEINSAVRNHPFARTLLADGLSEQTAIFDAPINGEMIRCKVRPDRTPSSKTACLIDLKSTVDAGYDAFLRACYRFGYFQQAAFYIDGYNEALRVMVEEHGWSREDHPEIDAFVFIAVEKAAPFRVEVYTLMGDNSLLIRGREDYINGLRIEQECRKNNFYPNYRDAGAQELVAFSER